MKKIKSLSELLPYRFLRGEELEHTAIQFIKFCMVGGFGVLVNLGTLWLLVEYGKLWYIFGSVGGIICSITSNFTFNKFWTFKRKFTKLTTLLYEYAKYWTVSIFTICTQLGGLYILVEFIHLWYILAAFIAIGVGTIINFLGNKLWTFGGAWKKSIAQSYNL
jgi:dolichol-phosphate mannosyltransferase